MDIRHVIFDIDGTLWDAAQQVTEAWNLVLERYEETKGIRRTVSDMFHGSSHEDDRRDDDARSSGCEAG